MTEATPAYRLIAAAFESPAALMSLLNAEPHLMSERTGPGETPLHYLAVENQVEAVKLLIAAGASVNTLNECHSTPLCDAASLGYADMVDLLLDHGARLEVAGQGEPALHGAVRHGTLPVVQRLLAVGASPNDVDDMGQTAVHVAAEMDQCEAVLRLLLDAGADRKKRDLLGDAPLDVAMRCGSARCADLLQAYDR